MTARYYLTDTGGNRLVRSDMFGTTPDENGRGFNYGLYLTIIETIFSAYMSYLQGRLLKKYYATQATISRLQTDLLKESLWVQAGIARMEGQAGKAYYETNAYIAGLNARIGEMQADLTEQLTEIQAGMLEDKAREAREIGHEREARYRGGLKKITGRQRAALAAQGIRIDEGSARDILLETADIGEIDATTIKINTARESFGYTARAIETRIHGRQIAAGQRAGAISRQATATDMMIRGAMTELAGNAEAIQNTFRMSWTELAGRSNILDLLTKSKVTGYQTQAQIGATLLTSIGEVLRNYRIKG